MFDPTEWTQWQLLRMETLSQIVRAFEASSRASSKKGDGSYDCAVPLMDDILVPAKSVAKGFVDKSYDVLSEACRNANITLGACRSPCDGVYVTLLDAAKTSALGEPSFLTVDDIDTVRSLCSGSLLEKCTAETIVNHVLRAASMFWASALGLTPRQASDPMAQFGGMMTPEALKSMMAMSAMTASTAAAELSEHNKTLLADIHKLRAVVALGATNAQELSVVAKSDAQGVVEITIQPATNVSPSDALYASLVAALSFAGKYLKSLGAPDGYCISPDGRPDLSPFTLLSAVISADRRQRPSNSALKFPPQLLEQLLWWCSMQAERSSSALCEADRLTFEQFLRDRERVEYPPQGVQQADDESDEDYMERVRPKSYTDYICPHLPCRL